ncbi:yteA family sporulation protein [Ectobacillus ponti]|uniref:YteA family sporulation protein n=1 Tax=Ectobacillus ponti TaxID=2961894 RepID=A0AA41X772_9BACI|nr:yteA family sporulation protein [Ectobacillus ponti]MCP8967590.1 yteA family sporulation protein [Ectobacillus ponti]
MLSQQQLEHFKAMLLKDKQELEQSIETHQNGTRDGEQDSTSELSMYDNHPADLATELYEREKDFGIIEFREKHLADVNHALERIENGTYGICEVCGEEIPLERLEALPTATTLVEHTHNKLNMDVHPVEEEVYSAPFGKHDMDNQHENVAYDAEDSWQDVANYGTSETPSDMDRRNSKHYNSMYIESGDPQGYVEPFENFIGTDIYGNNPKVYPGDDHELYEDMIDDYEERAYRGDLPENGYYPRR